jgi:uncharacterized membrane protein
MIKMKRMNSPTWLAFIVVLYAASLFSSINIGRIRIGVCRVHFSVRYVLIRKKQGDQQYAIYDLQLERKMRVSSELSMP